MLDAGGIGGAFGSSSSACCRARLQILRAMLVVNGERLLGFAAKRRRASRQRRQFLPGLGRFMRAAVAPPDPRQSPQRLACTSGSRADALGKLDRPQQRGFRIVVFTGALVDARQAVRLLRGRRPRGPDVISVIARASTAASEIRSRRLCSSTASSGRASPSRTNWKKRDGNFDSPARRRRDACRQMCFSSIASEQLESSGSGAPMVSGRCRHSRRAACSMSRCGSAVERARHAVKQEARLDQRHVEAAAVVGAQRAVRRGPRLRIRPAARARVRSRAAGTAATRIDVAFDRGAADEERLRARAAEEPGGLEVEEQDAGRSMPLRRPAAGHAPSLRASRPSMNRRDNVADRRAAVTHLRRRTRDRRRSRRRRTLDERAAKRQRG